MGAILFVAAGTLPRQELCSVLAVEGRISACKVPAALMDINGNQIVSGVRKKQKSKVDFVPLQRRDFHCM